jgi:hypothetical protein
MAKKGMAKTEWQMMKNSAMKKGKEQQMSSLKVVRL